MKIEKPLALYKEEFSGGQLKAELQKTAYGHQVLQIIKKGVKSGLVRQKTDEQLLEKIAKSFSLGTCRGEVHAAVATYIQGSRDITSAMKREDVIAGQVAECTKGMFHVAFLQEKNPKNIQKKRLKEIKKAIEKLQKKMNKAIIKGTHAKKVSKLQEKIVQVRRIFSLVKDHKSPLFLSKKLKSSQITEASKLRQELIIAEKKQDLGISGAKKTKEHEVTKSKKATKIVDHTLKKEKTTSHISITVSRGGRLRHMVVVFPNGKKPIVYDSNRGAIHYNSRKEAVADIKKEYFKKAKDIWIENYIVKK